MVSQSNLINEINQLKFFTSLVDKFHSFLFFFLYKTHSQNNTYHSMDWTPASMRFPEKKYERFAKHPIVQMAKRLNTVKKYTKCTKINEAVCPFYFLCPFLYRCFFTVCLVVSNEWSRKFGERVVCVQVRLVLPLKTSPLSSYHSPKVIYRVAARLHTFYLNRRNDCCC